jgi:hypothetical protein
MALCAPVVGSVIVYVGFLCCGPLWLVVRALILPLADHLIDDSELLVTGKHGVVSSDVDVCSQIGVDTMKKGGNAVDAAIGMLSALIQGLINGSDNLQ